jgi:AcrR family transcriptional regulator
MTESRLEKNGGMGNEAAAGGPKRLAGRPRNLETEQLILTVTLEQLHHGGYSRMSVDAIARGAGVSKPTIYRRWKGKADLAMAAICRLRLSEPAAKTGDPAGDLRRILRSFQGSLLRPYGMALIGTVLAEEERTPELLALFREQLVAPRRAMLRAALARARRRGRRLRNREVDAAVNMLIGSYYARYLSGEPFPGDWPERVVGLLGLD